MPKAIIRHCRHCEAPYTGHKSKLFCSDACRLAGHSPPWNKNKKGIAANRPRNGNEKTCEVCSAIFYVPRNRSDARYCSPACYRDGRYGKERPTDRTCPVCSIVFSVKNPSDNNVTCSTTCRRVHKSRLHQGEKSHFWRGGKMAPYSGIWRERRAAARDRDGHKCVLCGSIDRIQVHHKVPYRYSKSHELDNLITLCRSCHSREEYKVNAVMRNVLEEGRTKTSPVDHHRPCSIS